MEEMTKSDQKIFHMRFTGAILATDMAKHMEHVEAFKSRLQQLSITKEANNGDLFVTSESGKEQFD
jgi:cAMP-specific phosphodiesterase 4